MLSTIQRAEMLETLTEDECKALDATIRLLELGALKDDSIDSITEIFWQLLNALATEQSSTIYIRRLMDALGYIGISQRH